jgi:hypothetical protein
MSTWDEPAEEELLAPAHLADIDAAFLTALLRQRHPSAEVVAVRAAAPVHGTATKLLLHLTYATAGADLPERVWLKGGYEFFSPLLRAMYANEARFYRHIAPRLPINVPRCYASIAKPDGQSIVLLQDLSERPVQFNIATKPLSPEQAKRVLEHQARYHAASWGQPFLNEIDWLRGTNADPATFAPYWVERRWHKYLAKPRCDVVPAAYRDLDAVRYAVERVFNVYSQRRPQCFCHGDAHIGNSFFDSDGSAGYYDFQCVMRGRWAMDFVNFVPGALTTEDRRAHEKELLRHYLAHLSANGAPAPDFDEAWHEYRQFLMYGILWMMCPADQQPEEICSIETARYIAAAVDNDALGSID